MKTSLSWLQTHIDLTEVPVDKLRDILTFAGIEVEGVEVRGIDSDKIVVAQVLESVQHPNADRLSLCHLRSRSSTKRCTVSLPKRSKVSE